MSADPLPWVFGCLDNSSRALGVFPTRHYLPHVEESESIVCPFCGQSFEVVVDTSVAFQRFTTDCEVCCRPLEVVAESAPGEILSLDVQAG